MHENEISELIIAAAMEVHRFFGPGLVEKVYEEALRREFALRQIRFKRQLPLLISYKGAKIASDMRLDLPIEDKVIVDLKAKEQLSPIDKPKLLTYLRMAELHLGLIINFHRLIHVDGVSRFVNDLRDPA